MAAERKITDDDLARLRRLAGDGWSDQDLGEAFGITPQHVGRLIRGEQRPVIAAAADEPDDVAGEAGEDRGGSLLADLEAFLSGLELDAGAQVLAAAARSLAAKMDACQGSDSASAAQAMPRLNSQLLETLDRLRGIVRHEPDRVDFIRERRRARMEENAAWNTGFPVTPPV